MRAMENARVQCIDRNKWMLFCHSHFLEEVPRNKDKGRLDKIKLNQKFGIVSNKSHISRGTIKQLEVQIPSTP